MTAEFIQTTYRTDHDPFVAGQIANSMPNSCVTGRFVATTNLTDLKFGFAVGRTAERTVERGVSRIPIGKVLNNDNIPGQSENGLLVAGIKLQLDTRAGYGRIPVGSVLIIEDEQVIVTGTETDNITGNTESYYSIIRGRNSTTAAKHNINTDVYLFNAGPTNFAGVAVRNVALPGANDPVDTYNDNDLVTVGNYGDYVVVCDGAVTSGDGVSVNISTASDYADYGKFSNGSESATRLEIKGAVFQSDSTSIDGVNLAVLRLLRQPG